MEERRHLRLVESDKKPLPEWLRYLEAFKDIVAERRSDRRIYFTPPAREALYALAALRLGTPRKRIDQMLNLSPPESPTDAGWELGESTSQPAYESSLFKFSQLRLFATLEENFSLLRNNLLLWPQIVLGGGGGWADSVSPYLPKSRLTINRLPSAYAWHPKSIKRLQLEVLKQESLIRKYREAHLKTISSAVANQTLFSDRKKSKTVSAYESMLILKMDRLEKRRILLYDLAMAYGWRIESDRETAQSLDSTFAQDPLEEFGE